MPGSLPVTPRALTVAGSDSGGGAGIQADLKTFTCFGVYGMTAITAVTAQNTLGVVRSVPLDPEMVLAQIEAVRSDIGVDATKIGMLATAAIVRAVAQALRAGGLGPVVVDPVLESTGGQPLLDPEGRALLRAEILPLADVLTPNVPEAATLLGCAVGELDGMAARRDAARALQGLGPRHVVLKGGHARTPHGQAVDTWFDGATWHDLAAPRSSSRHTHGTGCTFSAAIAAGLAAGRDLDTALSAAKAYVSWGIAHAPGLGAGAGPLQHSGWPGRPAS